MYSLFVSQHLSFLTSPNLEIAWSLDVDLETMFIAFGIMQLYCIHSEILGLFKIFRKILAIPATILDLGVKI